MLLACFGWNSSLVSAQTNADWSIQKAAKLQQILDKSIDQGLFTGNQFAILYQQQQWQGAAGTLGKQQPYFIASTTKLFTTAIILQLRAEGRLLLSDSLPRFFTAEELEGLHRYKGRDYSHQITVAQLLAHSSGLADYFQDKVEGGPSLEKQLIAGIDQRTDFGKVLAINRKQKPHFAPGTKGKAHYSDTNFQLLGQIIERLCGQSFAAACQERIIDPLRLENTWLYADTADHRMAPLRYKKKDLHIPLAMASNGPDGGMVSHSADLLVFLQAFFGGRLFPATYLTEMQDWNRIFYPMQSGMGIHLFQLPTWMTLGKKFPALVGHSGLSGTMAYYSVEHELFIAGTVNQIAKPDRSFRLALKLIDEVLRH